MGKEPLKIAIKFTQENGRMIKGTEEEKKSIKTRDIAIRVHSSMISIMALDL
jgi:hypothetical protein